MTQKKRSKSLKVHPYVLKREIDVVKTCINYLKDKRAKYGVDVVIKRVIKACKVGVILSECGLKKADFEENGRLKHISKEQRKKLLNVFA